MIESFRTRVDIAYLNRSVSRIMTSAGGNDKIGLTFEDFKTLMMDYNRNVDEEPSFERHNDRRMSEATNNIGLKTMTTNERRMSESIIVLPGTEIFACCIGLVSKKHRC